MLHKISLTTLLMLNTFVKIYISRSFAKNEKVWPFSKNGQLTTKFAWRLISTRDDTNLSCMVNWKTLWRLPFLQDFNVWVEMTQKCYFGKSYY